MAKFKVVLLKHGYPAIDIERDVIENAGGELLDAEHVPMEKALEWCEEADGILVRWMRITPELLARFRRCQIVVRYGVGTDNVDVPAATRARIMVGHVPNYCYHEVSTHAIGLLLSCVRWVARIHDKMGQGGWDINPADKMYRMAGRTLGLAGFGHIGQSVAKKMRGWDMRILATDPYVEPARAAELGVELVSLEKLCRESDYLSLHVPLLPETRHLIGAKELAWLKPGAIVVNTARGPVLDSRALLVALNEGTVASAGLDVFEEEPLPLTSPLRMHPRVVLSDHVAWYSEESQVELRTTAAEEVARVCLGGLPESLANPEVLQLLGRAAEWTPNDTARWQMKRTDRVAMA